MRSADVVRVRERTAAAPDQVWTCRLADAYSVDGPDPRWPRSGQVVRRLRNRRSPSLSLILVGRCAQ